MKTTAPSSDDHGVFSNKLQFGLVLVCFNLSLIYLLACEGLEEEERQPQDDQEEDVHQQEDHAAVAEDGLGQVEEGVEAEAEGPGGGQGVCASGPLLARCLEDDHRI